MRGYEIWATTRDAVSGAQRSELAGVLNVAKGGAGYPGAE
jgi:hypothetical protein